MFVHTKFINKSTADRELYIAKIFTNKYLYVVLKLYLSITTKALVSF